MESMKGRGEILARRREGGKAAVSEGLLCARACVQVALNFELLHESMNCGGITCSSADQLWLCHLSEYPLEASWEHDKAHRFLPGHENPLLGALRAIYQKPNCSKATCHK